MVADFISRARELLAGGVDEESLNAVGRLLADVSHEPGFVSEGAMQSLHGSESFFTILQSDPDGLTLMLARFSPQAPTPVHDHKSWGSRASSAGAIDTSTGSCSQRATSASFTKRSSTQVRLSPGSVRRTTSTASRGSTGTRWSLCFSALTSPRRCATTTTRRRAKRSRTDPTPADAVLGVLERDAPRPQVFPDAVRVREVLDPAGSLALLDQPLDLLGQARLLGADHVEVRIDVVEQRQELRPVDATHAVGIQRGVGLTDVIENQADALRQVEVVVEGLAIRDAHISGSLRQLCVLGRGRPRPAHAVGELAKAAHLLGGRVERLGAEPDARAVVGVRDEEKANRQWIVSRGGEVAQRGEPARALRHLFARGVGEKLRVQPDP